MSTKREVSIPKGFIRDHMDRALPTPILLRETASHYVIHRDDPELGELRNDAEYYAGDGNDAPLWLKSAARALLAALKKAEA